MLNAIRAVFVGTSQSRLQQEENATDSIKSLRLKRGQTVADLTKEFGTLVDVRNDCAHENMSSPRMGFYFMEIMRKSQTESKLERDFATVLQSLDINQEQREEYEGVVNKFKAADEPQILALEKEESSNGSTRQAPEEMHAMNAETGGTDCDKCERFGKDECWTHSSFHCNVCDKRGRRHARRGADPTGEGPSDRERRPKTHPWKA